MFSRNVEIVFVVVIFAILFLGWLARRNPHIDWLQRFDLQVHFSEDQRESLRRAADVTTGIKFVLLGLAIPLIYVVMTVAFFDEFTTRETLLCAAASTVCIGLGVVSIVKAGRLP